MKVHAAVGPTNGSARAPDGARRRRLASAAAAVSLTIAGCGAASSSTVRASLDTASAEASSTTTAVLTPTTAAAVPSTAPVAAARLTPCQKVAVDVAGPTTLAVDPVQLAASNRLAPLPVPGLTDRKVLAASMLRTAQDYITGSGLRNPQARLAVMQRDGFQSGAEVHYQSGSDNYDALVLRFASPEAALDYTHAHLSDACDLTAAMTPLAGLAGVAFLRNDNLARAVFVAGDTEINLDICTCVEVKDRTTLAAAWANAIAQQLAATTP